MLKTSQELRDQIDDLRIKAKAILDVAKGEERDLSDDEQKSFDQLVDQADKLEESDLPRAIKREDLVAKTKQAAKLQARIDAGDIQFGDAGPSSTNFTVPARARATQKLKAYDNEREAYIAGQVILAGIFKNQAASRWCSDHGLRISNALGEGVNSTGGFLVPDEMERSLIRMREEYGVFPRYARNYPMGADTMQVPRLLADVTAYWVGENAEITASDVTLGGAELVAKKLACLSKISTEIDEDSVVDVGEMVTQSMAYSMAIKIDDAGFNGDGTSSYGGVMGLKNAIHANATVTAATGNTTVATLDLADFEEAAGEFPAYPGASPAWFFHKSVFWQGPARLQMAAGGNMVSDLGSGPQLQFLGYPVVFSQALVAASSVTTSTVYGYFGDLSMGATVGNRRGMSVKRSDDRYMEYDQIGIQVTERIAINIHERGDTIRNRPILMLKTPGS